MSLDLSIVLPIYNRTALLPHPLESLRQASASNPDLAWEIILVDDGSSEDVRAAVRPFRDLPIEVVRHEKNSGLVAARLAGLSRARGRAVFFLDADDAIAPGKLAGQLPALGGADVVYGDVARRSIDENGHPAGALRYDLACPDCRDPAEFYLAVQPAPHNPIFRREYLVEAVANAFFPPSRDYDPIAETWLYYQLSVRPARIVYAPGVWSIVGEPAGDRISRTWERLAAASLRLMQAFQKHCPPTAETLEARRRVGLCAFATWRALPRGFPAADAFLDVWRGAPPSPAANLGGPTFRRMANAIGPELAGRLCKLLQRPAYRRIRSVDACELRRLFLS